MRFSSDLSPVDDQILSLYEQGEAVLVFASQIIATSWTGFIAQKNGVCRKDRLISWDSFKEQVFFGTESRKPANALSRRIFTNEILRKNAREEKPFFTRLVPPRYRDRTTHYAPLISSVLPYLRFLGENGTAEVSSFLGEDKARDIVRLGEEYGKFLEDHSRYEPSWLRPQYSSDGSTYVIVHPELLDDYHDYSQQIESSPEVQVLPLEGSLTNEIRYFEYEDYRQELINTLDSVAGRLEDSVPPSDIIITLAGYEELLPRLQFYAQSAGIPLNPRRSRPLIDFPSVRWLREIAEMYTADFSFDSIRRLITNPSLIWKNPSLREEILQTGINDQLLEGGRKRWIKAVKKKPTLSAFFTDIDAIRTAGSATELFNNIYRFLGSYLRTGLWSEEDSLPWTRAAEAIKTMEADLADFSSYSIDPFPLALEQLSGTAYLPQSSQTGVAVYDYRVAAGISAKIHYAVGFSADATSMSHPLSRLFRKDQLEKLNPEVRRVPGAILDAYRFSGSTVSVGFSRRSPGGAQLPCVLFLQGNKALPVVKLAERWLRPSSSPVDELRGDNHSPGWDNPQLLLNRDSWPESEREDVVALRQAPVPETSVTRLESFIHCRFGYLWNLLNLREVATRPQEQVYDKIGIAFHRIMELIISRCSSEGSAFESSRIEEYLKIKDMVIKRSFGFDRKIILKGISELVQQQIRPRFSRAAGSIIIHLAKWADSAVFETESEQRVEKVVGGSPVAIRGRIDALLHAPGYRAVLDFKTGSVPRKVDIQRGIKIQLPVYALMLADNEVPVLRMGYYSTKWGDSNFPGAFTAVLDGTGNDDAFSEKRSGPAIDSISNLEELWESLYSHIIEWQSAHKQGDFRPDANVCTSCRFPGLCRTGFNVRMEGEQ